MNSNFRQIECFLDLSKSLSFSRTGEKLGIAQSAVTKHIKHLEEELGSQLFLRTKKSVSLTEKGRELYKQIHPYFNGLISELEDFANESQFIRGNLSIGCLREVGERVFLKKFSQFKKDQAEINLHIRYLKSFEIVQQIKEGNLDIGIVSEKVIEENLRTYKIFEEEIVIVAGHQNKQKISQDNIKLLPFVCYRPKDPLLDFFLKKASPGGSLGKITTPIIVNSHKSMIDILKQHSYYAVLPRHSVKEELKNKQLIQVSKKSYTAPLYLIYQDLNIKDKKVEALKKLLLAR